MMAVRIGRHGGLCFLLDDQGLISALSDGRRRKDAVPFRELALPADETGFGFDTKGPSFARQLGSTGLYAEIDRRIAELGLPFRVDAAGFEQDHSSNSGIRRDLHYHELDAVGAVAITLNFILEQAFRWEVECSGLRATGQGFELPGGLRVWISAAQPVGHDNDRLWIDLDAGKREVLLVVLSRHTDVELHDTALIVRPEDAPLAATVQMSVRRLVPVLPVVTDGDARAAGAVLTDLGISRATVVEALAGSIDALGLGEDAVEVISAVPHGIVPDNPALAVYEALVGPEKSAGLVVCDSALPCVRVIAAAYAGLAGFAFTLIDADEEPITPPDWSSSDAEPLEIRIERYRAALTEQVSRVIAPQLPTVPPPVAIVVTRGYAYSLLRGAHGPWAGEVELGMLPENQAPALLLRALGHGVVPPPRFGVSLIVDALARQGGEYETVRSSAEATVVRPVGLRGLDATAATVHGAIGALPIDLLTLICHGERDFVELANGPLTATQVATWRLPNAPVVVNNSCGSWHTTGAAFVTAGARAYVGTLWPIKTDAAAEISAGMTRALTSAAEVRVGRALRDALTDNAKLEYDDRYAYVLVGLPTIPARIAPMLDDRQRSEIAEHGLRTAYVGAGRLAREGDPDTALFLRAKVIAELESDLRAAVNADELGGYLEVHNAPGAHLGALVASYEALFWGDVAEAGAASVNDAIMAYERAVDNWEEVLAGDQSFILPVERRPKVVAGLLAQLTDLLMLAGRAEHAWRAAMRTVAALTSPVEPVLAEPPDADNAVVVDAAGLLSAPSSFLNSVGLAAAALGRPAESIYLGAVRYATSPGEAGRAGSNLAKLHLERGSLTEAEAGFAVALPLLEQAGDTASVGVTRGHIARLRLDQGDLAGAERLARELGSTLQHGTGAWWDANAVLIRALSDSQHFTEAAGHAGERHRIACADGNAEMNWQALSVLLDLRLRSVIAGADPAGLVSVVRAAAATIAAFPTSPSPARTKIAELLAANRQHLLVVLGDDADTLMEVVTGLRATKSSPAERQALVDQVNSSSACLQVDEACEDGAWLRECVVWLSPQDGRTRSMILDRPPPSLATPAYVRFPVVESRHATVTDAFVEHVDCWARTLTDVSYRYDGTPGLIVIEKTGLVQPIRHGHRYRDIWGSRQFQYHVTVTLPELAILTAVDVKLRSLGPSPRVGVGRRGQNVTVVLDPDPVTAELVQREPVGILDPGWLATVTIEFADLPPIHEVLIEHLDEDQLVPLNAYTKVMNTFATALSDGRH